MNDMLTEKVSECVRRIAEYMHIECEIQVAPADAALPLAVVIRSPDQGKLLIGKNGQNLRAFEQVVRAMTARHDSTGKGIVIDVNDYRRTRTIQLLDLARQIAGQVRATGKSEALPPMTSYERRIVHTELASWSDVATESVGLDPLRRIVIKPL
jgi:spoIIIJ-associated protein